jgi:hypothetical protein
MDFNTFGKLKDFVEKELTFNEDNVERMSLNFSNIYMKYLRVFTNETKILKELYYEKQKMFGKLLHHFKFEVEFQLDSKSEIESYIRSDDNYYNLCLKYSNQEIIVDYLEKTLSRINTMGFEIKNYIEIIKLKKGLI